MDNVQPQTKIVFSVSVLLPGHQRLSLTHLKSLTTISKHTNKSDEHAAALQTINITLLPVKLQPESF